MIELLGLRSHIQSYDLVVLIVDISITTIPLIVLSILEIL